MWFVLKIWVWFVYDTLKLGQVHVYIATLPYLKDEPHLILGILIRYFIHIVQ